MRQERRPRTAEARRLLAKAALLTSELVDLAKQLESPFSFYGYRERRRAEDRRARLKRELLWAVGSVGVCIAHPTLAQIEADTETIIDELGYFPKKYGEEWRGAKPLQRQQQAIRWLRAELLHGRTE